MTFFPRHPRVRHGPLTRRCATTAVLLSAAALALSTRAGACSHPDVVDVRESLTQPGARHETGHGMGLGHVQGAFVGRGATGALASVQDGACYLPIALRQVALSQLPTPQVVPPAATADIRTAVAGTLTAIAPPPTRTPGPGTAAAATLTALAPPTSTATTTGTATPTASPSSSPTPSPTDEPTPSSTAPATPTSVVSPPPATETSPVPPGPSPTLTVTPTASLTPWPPSDGIYGRVTNGGTATAGVPLALNRWDGAAMTEVRTTSTSADGSYRFGLVPALQSGESYHVVFGRNEDDPSRLALWLGREIAVYDGQGPARGGDFELGDVPLVAPPDNATATVPVRFAWQPRGVPGDSYVLELESVATGEVFSSAALGAVSEFVVRAFGAGFAFGTPYEWHVLVLTDDDGAGLSFQSRRITVERPWLFDDDFCDPSSGWPTRDNPEQRAGYLPGPPCEYQLLGKQPYRTPMSSPGISASAYVVETTVRATLATGIGAAGILFDCSADESDFKIFTIGSRGYGVWWHDASGRWWDVVDDTPSSLIDLQAGNTLKMVAVGNTVMLYIDGQHVHTIDFGGPRAGKLGVCTEIFETAGFDARFSRFTVFEPPSLSAPSAARSGIGLPLQGAMRPGRAALPIPGPFMPANLNPSVTEEQAHTEGSRVEGATVPGVVREIVHPGTIRHDAIMNE